MLSNATGKRQKKRKVPRMGVPLARLLGTVSGIIMNWMRELLNVEQLASSAGES